MHVDIDAADIDAEGDRLERLGATTTGDTATHEHGTRWIVFASMFGAVLGPVLKMTEDS